VILLSEILLIFRREGVYYIQTTHYGDTGQRVKEW